MKPRHKSQFKHDNNDMKLITIVKDKEGFKLIIIERPMTATSIVLTQQEINELAKMCDIHRTDNFRTNGYDIPKL